MKKNNLTILENINKLPPSHGCYLFIDKNNEVIYVGKANNIKNRVKQYFNRVNSPKTQLLVSNIEKIDFQITNSEDEALILETNLINKHNPKYNIKIKNSISYPYITYWFDGKEVQLFVTRKIGLKNRKYFGPYPDGYSAYKIVEALKEILPFNKCSIHSKGQPCLYYSMGKCLGQCFKKVEKSEWQKHIDEMEKYFKGDIESIVQKLDSKIEDYSSRQQFEHARNANLIKQNLLKIKTRQSIIFSDSIHRDVFATYYKDGVLSISIALIRFGKLIYTTNQMFKVYSEDINNDISQFIYQYYLHNTIPEEIILETEELKNIIKSISNNIVVPISGKKYEVLNITKEHAKEKFNFDIKIFESKAKQIETSMKNFKELLKISKLENIEMIDISSLMGEQQVGVTTAFKNGEPNKSKYRKYIITTVDKQDDYKSIEEVVYRHFRNKLLNNEELPDLFIVDGKNQVKVAQKVLNKLNIKINLIGLVKNKKHQTESIYTPSDTIINLNKRDYLFNILSNIQDETHRFAISFHKQKRTKAMLSVELDEMKFLTIEDKDTLYREFETIRNIKHSNKQDIAKVIGSAKAKKLIEYLDLDQ